MLPLGVGEESLLPGSYVLTFYTCDSVWHERAVLWKIGGEWEVITSDDDKYFENLMTGRGGPARLIILPASGEVPDSVTDPVY